MSFRNTRIAADDVQTKEDYSKIRFLMIDEVSNADNKSMAGLLMCFPNLRHIVLVFDAVQISPIQGGDFARNVLEFMRQKKIRIGSLVENMRVHPDSRQLVANDQLMMRGMSDDMVWKTLPPLPSETPIAPGAYLEQYHGVSDEAVIRRLECLFMKENDFKMIALTNKERITANAIRDRFEKKRRGMVIDTVKFYSGQELTISNRNYRQLSVAKNVDSDAICNGEEFKLAHIQKYNEKQGWSKHTLDRAPVDQTTLYGREHVFFNSTQGKKYCVGYGFVDEANVEPAWTITSGTRIRACHRLSAANCQPVVELFLPQSLARHDDSFQAGTHCFW